MPALTPTEFSGMITWLGRVVNRADSARATPLDEVFAGFSGIEGDDHAGLTRASCSRVSQQYAAGTTIRNTRQLSILSDEELEKIAQNLGVEAIDPGWLGASIVVRGIADFSHVPPSSRLIFASKATVTVDVENGPCHLPAKVIDQDTPGLGKGFKAAASGLRGVTGWVEREGVLRLGDALRLHVPNQKNWQHA